MIKMRPRKLALISVQQQTNNKWFIDQSECALIVCDDSNFNENSTIVGLQRKTGCLC